MEHHDFNVANGNVEDLPSNDGTNACVFFAIRIIERVFECRPVSLDKICKIATSVITVDPQSFNLHRDVSCLYDFYEAYNLLSRYSLVNHVFFFDEMLVDNVTIYSNDAQMQFLEILETLKDVAISRKEVKYAIMHARVYIFSIVILPSGLIIVIKTHPIPEVLNGNGNGLLVSSHTPVEIFKWLTKRFHYSKLPRTTTPYLIAASIR